MAITEALSPLSTPRSASPPGQVDAARRPSSSTAVD